MFLVTILILVAILLPKLKTTAFQHVFSDDLGKGSKIKLIISAEFSAKGEPPPPPLRGK